MTGFYLGMWSIPVAAVVGFMAGGLWYGVLGKLWMRAAGMSQAEVEDGSPLPFVVAGVANLLMAAILYLVIDRSSAFTLSGCWEAAIFLWLGFIVTSIGVNYSFQMRPLSLFVIDAGHWLLVLLSMGAALALLTADRA